MQTTMHARPLQAAQPSAMPRAARRMGCGGLPPRRCQMPQTDAHVPLQPRSRDARHRLVLARAAGPPGFGPIGENRVSAHPGRPRPDTGIGSNTFVQGGDKSTAASTFSMPSPLGLPLPGATWLLMPALVPAGGDARIKVIGVGGGGGNAVNRMVSSGLQVASPSILNLTLTLLFAHHMILKYRSLQLFSMFSQHPLPPWWASRRPDTVPRIAHVT